MKNEDKISIGKLAKKANVSVRTLQYYDKIGLLKPSLVSEGGRRYYDVNDVVILHQIKTLKSLGLTLDEIKNHVISVQSPTDIIIILNHHHQLLIQNLSRLKKIMNSIEMLKADIKTSHRVDWSKYASMMKLVQENNDYYWISTYLDQEVIEKIIEVDKEDTKGSDDLIRCLKSAIELEAKGVDPTSEEAQQLVDVWWNYMNKYTNGNDELMEKLYQFYRGEVKWPAQFGDIQQKSQPFMEAAVGYYLANRGLIYQRKI